MRLYFWTALALSLFCTLAFADDQQTFTDSANWAKQTASQALTPNALPLNIDEYCADATCRRDIRAPKEANLSDSDINAQKGAAFASNEVAQSINANFNQGRPDIKNDPALRFALLGQENAFEITHGISNQYVDCNTGQQCLQKSTPRVCNMPTNNAVPCLKTPSATVITSTVFEGCNEGWSREGRECKLVTEQCKFDHLHYIEVGQNWSNIGSFWNGVRIDRRPFGPKWIKASDGNYYRQGERATWGSNGGRLEICKQEIDITPLILTCEEGFSLSGGNCIKNTFSWKTECSLIKNCQMTHETCIEGKETRIVNGIPETLDCWKYQSFYQCQMTDTCQSLPSECETVKTQCRLKQNGVCVEQEVTKNCFEKSCRTTQMQCGEQSFCLDGDCYTEEPKLNGNFDKSVAALAGLSEAVKDIGDPPQIFTGKPMKCDKKLAGFNDCCKDSGWGQNLGAKCSEAEEALGKAKEKGLTLYVGEYCASKVLGVCTRKKRSYCVYDSKLAKIIQEQGSIGQLGKGLGSAKNPTCAAITPEELGQINFEYIDFQEFYPEMHANAQLPNFDEIKKRLQSATGN
ncbi:type-F conjugative transfer system mating-pair stabilization protein TraN [Vibrio vulnificus]